MSPKSLVDESMRLGQFMSDEISCALHPYGLSIQHLMSCAYCVVAMESQLLFNTSLLE